MTDEAPKKPDPNASQPQKPAAPKPKPAPPPETPNTARKEPRPELIAKKPKRAREPRLTAVIDQHGCTGCEACIVFCPVDCIEIVPGADWASFQQTVEVDIERCIGCQLCAKHCPWDTIPMLPYKEGIEKAPSMTIKSACGHKTRDD